MRELRQDEIEIDGFIIEKEHLLADNVTAYASKVNDCALVEISGSHKVSEENLEEFLQGMKDLFAKYSS